MLICLSLALIAGLLMSRAAKAVRLPAVTAYLLTGLLLGPFFLGRLGLSRFGFGFGSLVAVEGYGILTQVALEQGRIDPMSVVLEPLLEIALSLALGAAAGYLLNLLEVYFHSRSKRMSLSVAFVLLTVGLSMTKFEINGTRCGFSLLLVCMMTGTVFCNVCPTSDELMDRLDRWVSPINILFFVLSGAELDLTILTNPMVLLIGVVYIVARSAGKISGSYLSCRATSCSPAIQKYLGITLLPQAGVALGMAATAAELSDGHMVRNVVLFSVLVYELVGPTLTKISLVAAGEIRPEGRTSARVENQPEAPVELS